MFFRLPSSLFLLTFILFAGCGEIDLPQRPDDPKPEQTEEPEKTETSDHPEDSDNSETPDHSEESDEEEAPDHPETPETPDHPEDSDKEEAPDHPETPETPDIVEPPEPPANPEASEAVQVGHATFTADGHLLIADRFYLSLEQYPNVYSANNTSHTDDAAEIAANYAEGNLDSGWRIPTSDEVAVLLTYYTCRTDWYDDYDPAYASETPALNRELDRRDLPQFVHSLWYLYDDATRVFSIKLDAKTKKAAATSRYALRLVHDKD